MDQLYSKKVGKGLWFFSPHYFVCIVEYNPNNYIIEDLVHSWSTSSKKMGYVWVLFFNKGLIRHLFFEETLHFEAFKAILLSKVNGSALLKEGGTRILFFFAWITKHSCECKGKIPKDLRTGDRWVGGGTLGATSQDSPRTLHPRVQRVPNPPPTYPSPVLRSWGIPRRKLLVTLATPDCRSATKH